ncbi:MAG TPA: hypothetical protein VI731_10910 [Bacteroidia bacterium]|nr:hypothetical protein [Bacteroidia bacterium]
MALCLKYCIRFLFLVLLLTIFQTACSLFSDASEYGERIPPSSLIDLLAKEKDSVTIRFGTFLGNEKRNYYGDSASGRLDVIWKLFLGSGSTIVSAEKGEEEWYGAGWTGQPLVVDENGKTFLLQGAFDHHLKKIDASNGNIVWEYLYDDILKGTGTIWVNDSAENPEDRILILQGSRKGLKNPIAAKRAESYRAVSYFSGKEIWRMNVSQTASYSRDVDASALIFKDTAYIGLENGRFIAFEPGRKIRKNDSVNYPCVFEDHQLYSKTDADKHGGNLVTESSPVRIGDHIYIAAGSGHVYGYNLHTRALDWDFFIGSDIDGTPVVTGDSCLLVAVEKQYIQGKGGVYKLNPRRDPEHAVDWYYPVNDFQFSSWKGGVIGSVAVNDAYNIDGAHPCMAAFTGIDGYLTVVSYDRTRTDTLVKGSDGIKKYLTPIVLFRQRIGSSISTPLFVQDKLIAGGYGGIHLYRYDQAGIFNTLDYYSGIFEATPVADQGKIYAASRDGFLYCFGDTSGIRADQQDIIPKVIPAQVVHVQNSAANQEIKTKKSVVSIATETKEIKKAKAAPVVAPKVETPKVLSATPPSGKTSHLVAGAFRVKTNAESSVIAWQKKGVAATMMLNANLYYVILASSPSSDIIQERQAEMHQKFGVDAWIFVK